MPNPLLSTGDEGKNQDGHALVGAKDDALSSTCSHQTFATRDEMKSNIKNRICNENFIIPFALLTLMTACGDNTNGKRQENVEQNIQQKKNLSLLL